MKNIIKLFLFYGLFTFSSCQKEENLDPRPELVGGQFARLDITNDRIKIDDPNSYFGGPLTTPSNNIVTYNLYVRRRANIAPYYLSNYYLVKSISSFPVELKVTKEDIASALSIPVTSLLVGDIYNFNAETFDTNGNRIDFYNLSGTVRSTISMKQGYRFSTDMQTIASYEKGGFPNYDSNY